MMSGWNAFWAGLGRAARIGLVAGVIVIAGGMSLLAWTLLHTEYAVLFTDLSERDLSSMAGELDKQHVAYKVDERSHALLVPQDQVHKVRLKLMGAPLALNGAVGFELFNNSDFAMTEFAQKVNYQRALQGELTRTIMSLDEVQTVRVHLALPEQGLFKKTVAKAKASVTLQLKPGRTLSAEQVLGVQRLVAASVNDIQAQDVAVLDQHGVVLSRSGTAEDGGAAAANGLDLKQSTEAYLARKATAVVERLFGTGEALVSVDAELVHEQSRVTTEEVLAAKATGSDAAPSGVVVRERVTSRDASSAAPASDKAGGSVYSTQETEYQTGKRVEQVVTPAGQLKRLHVAVVVRRAMDEAQVERLRELVAAAVGLNRARGDVIAVQSMAGLSALAQEVAAPPAASGAGAAVSASAPARPVQPAKAAAAAWPAAAGPIVLAALLALAALGLVLARRRPAAAGPRPMGAEQREQMLAQVESWLAQEPRPALRGER